MIERGAGLGHFFRLFGSVLPRSLVWGIIGGVEGAILDYSARQHGSNLRQLYQAAAALLLLLLLLLLLQQPAAAAPPVVVAANAHQLHC